MARNLIELQGITNRFGTQIVHEGLDMQVQEGEVFGIVGGSGSGKSVLLRTILGLRRPQAGRVLLEGQDITQMQPEPLRAQTVARVRRILDRQAHQAQPSALARLAPVVYGVEVRR